MSYRIADELRRDLLLHLPFSEGAGNRVWDTSQYRNNGVFGGAPTWVDGQIGKALHFDENGWVNCGNDASLNLDKTGITMETVLKLESFSGETMLKRGEQSSPGFFWNMINNQRSYFQYRAGGSHPNQTSKILPIELNEYFQHVILIDLANEKVTWYIDGRFIDENTTPGIRTDPLVADLLVGSYYNYAGSGWHLNGTIDEVRFYGRLLDRIEIRNLNNLRQLI